MGAKLSKLKETRRALQAEAARSQSVAAKSLDNHLPQSEEVNPGSWRFFVTQEERSRFIGAVLLVLTDNGRIDIHNNRIDLYYSRRAPMQVRVVLAIMGDNGIKHTHIGHAPGASEKEAFRNFVGEIYWEFEKLLVDVARNARPKAKAAQAPAAASRPSTPTKLRHSKTTSSLNPQAERAPDLRVRFEAPNKAPAGPVVAFGDRQATIPASLAHRVINTSTSMMDLLENRYENSPQQSRTRVRNMQSVPTMRSQSYTMSGALPEEEYEEPLVYSRPAFSRRTSFATAPTHYEYSERNRLHHSRSHSYMPAIQYYPAGQRQSHLQSMMLPTEDQPLPRSRRPSSSRHVTPMPSIASVDSDPPEQPAGMKKKKKLADSGLKVQTSGLRVVNGYPSSVRSKMGEGSRFGPSTPSSRRNSGLTTTATTVSPDEEFGDPLVRSSAMEESSAKRR